jgi:rfaE bifunctional protein kinase chain/domain
MEKITHMSSQTSLVKYLDEFRNKKLLVIGDAIIDHYIYGITSKISPDAPVPLVDVSSEDYFLGSLGKTIEYIQNMRGDCEIVSCVGTDFEGQLVVKTFKDLNLVTNGIIQMGPFTPRITRIMSQGSQVLRLEKRYTLSQDSMKMLNNQFSSYIEERIDRCDAILILDYDLGLLNPILISQILNLARQHDKKVIVRPEERKYYLYQQAHMIEMNRSIASAATGVQPINETCMRIMGSKIINEVHSQGVFIPWIEGDSYYFQKDEVKILPTLLKHKANSFSGIGSATAALLGLMATTSAPLFDCIQMAHMAGSFAALQINKHIFTFKDFKQVIQTGKVSTD